MLQSGERETEILLGNKQLLAVFFVGAALLGAAFTGGYMVGRGATAKKTTANVTGAGVDSAGATATMPSGGETHSVPPDDAAPVAVTSSAETSARKASGDLLGSRKKKGAKAQIATEEPPPQIAPKQDGFTPQGGQEFLQVAAVPHDHALAVAAVLRKKGFHAHAVSKPGDPNLYRVIVGPIRDAGELSSTRDSLRKTGFSQVIVQHYQ